MHAEDQKQFEMPSPIIDYSECLKDSPSFRQQLGKNEASLDELEARLEKLVKTCSGMVESGKSFITQQAQMISSLWELSSYYASEQETETTADINKMIHVLQEHLKFHNTLVDQANKSIAKNLDSFLRGDMKQMKETRGYFNKISNDLDSALTKNATVSKSRPSDLEDASNLLTATRSCFRYTGMDYVYQISMLQQKKKHIVVDSLSNYMGAYNSFHREATGLMLDNEPTLKEIKGHLVTMTEVAAALEKQLEKRHTYVTQEENMDTANQELGVKVTTGKPVKIEGYLFKRGQNAFRTWNRRWFYLCNNKLYYSKRNGDDVTILEDDLRICLVRPLTDIDRRYCFEIISPTKSHVLQADSEHQYKLWLATLQQGISSALHDQMSRDSDEDQWEDSDTEEAQDSKNSARLSASQQKKVRRSAEQILVIPGNQACADCGAPEPQWASINWGVVLCIECGGIHRSLGVHITKVRGIKLDVWDPEILKVMAELGNTIVNNILEACTGDRKKPQEQDSRSLKEEWIKDKYKEKKFVNRNVFQSESMTEADAWTVKRLRRRVRGQKNKKIVKEEDGNSSEKEAMDKDEKDIDTSQEDQEDSSLLESVLKASTLSGASSSSWIEATVSPNIKKVLNAEVCLFGGSLGKHHVASLELDSDQESTDGEGEESWAPPTDPLELLNPNMLLYRAARAHNLPVMLQALSLGADTEWRCDQEEGRTSIHQSILSGSVMATELLILNSVTTATADSRGDTALHLAAKHGNTGQVCLLLKHRADHHKLNEDGKEPLDIAVGRADADIVTLLRLAALNEEIRESDMAGDDDTFNDVVQEFSQMVYTHPERLQKKGDKK